nr:DUF3575 domain-containing protein [Bacteroides helcogenes]
MLKRMMWLPLVMLSVLPLRAQSQSAEADSVYEFRFVPQKDVFFIPYKDNLSEMQRLSRFVGQYRQEIADGRLPLHVDGYCSSLAGAKANLAVAKLRSNRVKSELLILHNGLREECFITRNHAEGGDFVTVRIIFPATLTEDADKPTVQPKEENASAVAGQAVTEKEPEENASVSENTVSVSADLKAAESSSVLADLKATPYTLALRANLLRWATLTPDLGVEWRINRNVGILVNGSRTSWSWDNKNRRYALWRVSPEVRYYIGKEKRAYLGAMYRFGEFNYKLGDTGKQGDLQGGGITGGWQLPLSRALAIDFSLGLGYIRTDYDEYVVIDGVRVKQGSESKNRWGPVSAGVTLMWKLF